MSGTTWPKRNFRGSQPWEKDEPPITPRAGLPVLAAGSIHPILHEVGHKLAELGYPNPISEGRDPFDSASPEFLAAVRRFRADYNVLEEPTDAFGGNNKAGQETADNHIGPWTLEAILRAHDELEEPQAA